MFGDLGSSKPLFLKTCRRSWLSVNNLKVQPSNAVILETTTSKGSIDSLDLKKSVISFRFFSSVAGSFSFEDSGMSAALDVDGVESFVAIIECTDRKCVCKAEVEPPPVFMILSHILHLADCPSVARRKCFHILFDFLLLWNSVYLTFFGVDLQEEIIIRIWCSVKDV